ncbi:MULTISPECIES: DUF305 domain-containing protein [Mycolicibacterium]|uniref:DUF305 domain-containing protein n=1 Tax=Mycolicibacterium vanbaalenii (strain DSM 7251 / JCM 13017 / BCRC 16820 / KCTC 9966 / NRRL B-24157 / PYR-1) TaxID=350058 RepID=A1T1H5_MYCVP|nr:DUF305 domain-containing protein [Mycolicibacterium vanbaalenii]ABM11025.1 protein of unknown function DUF305 [Mycolicibacterium vanbaalenii PYR-1]MCV7128240.1 DUF305 domain-containing protein [Mycolicibacterium vanbaalenii PYR-1]
MTTLMARVIAVVAALVLLAACGGQSDGADDSQSGSNEPEAPLITGDPAGYNAADIAFAYDMVPHHAQAIDLSRTALERSTNPELTALAQQIVATQQPEINILNVFLVQWNENPENRSGPDDGGPERALPGTVDEATITKLESLSGPEFDKLWLQSMIGQHQGAVELANTEIADGANVDAIAIARNIVAAQEAQIAQMTQMLEGLP